MAFLKRKPSTPRSNNSGDELNDFYESHIKPRISPKQDAVLMKTVEAIKKDLDEEEQKLLVDMFTELASGMSMKALLGFR